MSRPSGARPATPSRPTCGSCCCSCSCADSWPASLWRWPSADMAAPRLRWLFGAAGGTALAGCLALALLLPPRGVIARPGVLRQRPGHPGRAADHRAGPGVGARDLGGAERAARRPCAARVAHRRGGPGATSTPPWWRRTSTTTCWRCPRSSARSGRGPSSSSGTSPPAGRPSSSASSRRIVGIGDPFVFVSGNHDSDALVRRMALAGGIVLTERGRCATTATYGPLVVRVRGLRVAGLLGPVRAAGRASASGPQEEPRPDAEQREEFRDWLRPLLGRVDVVMVHEPQLAEDAAEELRRDPPAPPARAPHRAHAHRPTSARRRTSWS